MTILMNMLSSGQESLKRQNADGNTLNLGKFDTRNYWNMAAKMNCGVSTNMIVAIR